MSDKAYMAIVIGPEGQPWEETATVMIGGEAEYKATRWAQAKFMNAMLGHLFKKGADRLSFSFWEVARENGFKCIATEVDIQSTPTDK